MDFSKIAGRNDPCPCKSGKKYKKCCEPISTLINKLPGKYYSESYILSDIVGKSLEFDNFYKNERSKISSRIYWLLTDDFRSKMRVVSYPIDGKIITLIKVKKVPIDIQDAFDVAHELQHILCELESYPSVGFNELIYEDLAATVSTMLNDPIANERLVKYGFDLWKHYDEAVNYQKDKIEKNQASEPETSQDILFCTAFYILKVLDSEVACIQSSRSENEFLDWYENRFPRLTNEAKEILKLIKVSGYKTPNKCALVFWNLIRRYNMGSALKVIQNISNEIYEFSPLKD